jgi:FdhE protein
MAAARPESVMVQRILQPHEIESLDQTTLPRLRPSRLGEVFLARAKRLRHLADGNPIGPYLGLMAAVADAQHEVAQSLATSATLPAITADALMLARQHGMPPLAAAGAQGQWPWHDVLMQLIERIEREPALPKPARATLAHIARQSRSELEAQVQALLAARENEVDVATAPFLMAALQTVWTARASQLREADVGPLEVATVCPCCGTLPVASTVHIGGRYQGLRYLECGLCATQWHMVRVKCTHCESTEGIAYYTVEGAGDAIKAEACDHCHSYRKICYMEKDQFVEPLADDLATIALDVLMGEAGFVRRSCNPFLWQADDGTGDDREDGDVVALDDAR